MTHKERIILAIRQGITDKAAAVRDDKGEPGNGLSGVEGTGVVRDR